MKILSFSLLLSLLSFTTQTGNDCEHEFYFSVMTMEANKEQWTLEVEFRLFSNDLEKALGETDDFHLRLGDKNEHEQADKMIFDYLCDKISVRGDGWNVSEVAFIGKEVKNEITYVYVEYSQIKSWGEVYITNNLFFEHFPDQQNQLSYVHGQNIKTQTCFKDYPTRTFNFGK